MLKISQGQIKENCDNINDNNNDYPNLSLKTKLLIKKKFSESDDVIFYILFYFIFFFSFYFFLIIWEKFN